MARTGKLSQTEGPRPASVEPPRRASKPVSVAKPACHPMVAIDNYEGVIVAKQICIEDFEDYNARRWARMKPGLAQAREVAPRAGSPVEQLRARGEALSMISEREALRLEYARLPDGDRKRAIRQRLDDIDKNIGSTARAAVGLQGEYAALKGRIDELYEKEYYPANTAMNESWVDGVGPSAVTRARMTDVETRLHQFNARVKEIEGITLNSVPGLEDDD